MEDDEDLMSAGGGAGRTMPGTMSGSVRADSGLRLLRAMAFAAVCVAVSASAHAAASGMAPTWSLLTGWVVMVCLVTPLAGRERSRPGIVATLLCGQVFLHAMFCLGQHPAPAVSIGTATGPMPGMGAQSPPAHTVAGHGMSGHAMPGHLLPDPTMFAVHLIAAFLLGWVVHRGERAVWRMVRLSQRTAEVLTRPLAGLVAALVRPQVAVGLPAAWLRAPHRRDAEAARNEIVVLGHTVVRRGPPATTAV
ncbi:hypothetical protein E1293_00030 [Actinomadura darangshiensis]|uniref:Uncharacterized protein n=1 Tax=Actinomadura darangshiensis TaxID=705336 RepID=A0A4R5C7A4_9ACTN|nr:hypothetical protein [Actinomadura darangshiensis]TDD92904.1 hypothetical protein E1293_00030 [Actinomadura darangshiensis]